MEGRRWWDTWWLDNESGFAPGAIADEVAEKALQDYNNTLH